LTAGGITAVEKLFRHVAGLDIHKKTIVACVRITDNRRRVKESVLPFSSQLRRTFLVCLMRGLGSERR
jgi:hypothetical protein